MSSRTRRRSFASRFDRGSSKQSTSGSRTSARGDGDPLLLAARELRGQPRVETLEADQGQLLPRLLVGARPGRPVTVGP